ncbi:guanine deaminase isoform X3 [Thrips palmi]|uniref:Guanine deaminase isoform X3 n=1 Tax=Thrips palmi TaxID=161013 RepID=A0A6P8Z0M5_THRPL|nr:guanine deaminase isoform X3 [Thrips palmi]
MGSCLEAKFGEVRMESSGVFLGPFIHSERFEQVTVVDDGILIVRNGKVVLAEALRGRDAVTLASAHGVLGSPVVLRPGQLLLPGFVDAHVHAPQFPNAGLGYDKTLLDWLATYTFPLEARYADQEFATRVYDAVVRRCLGAGTTLACYFATIHTESSLQLARCVARAGQRALIGKVNMNVNNPEFYNEATQQSIDETHSFVDSVRAMQNSLVQPVITPRFAISCDMDLMKRLGDIARTKDLHIQTHISENIGEVEAVRGLYQQCSNYADVYDKAGLLTKKVNRAGARRAPPGGGAAAAGGAGHVGGALPRVQHVSAQRHVRRAAPAGRGRHGGTRHRCFRRTKSQHFRCYKSGIGYLHTCVILKEKLQAFKLSRSFLSSHFRWSKSIGYG